MSASTDYLVVGAGAVGMAFVDSVFHESDATFTIVDRRYAPGGHWNDAYPFVGLHQPALMYGAASRPLGSSRIEEAGFNQGLMAVASGMEVAEHFHALVRETFRPSGRVMYCPMSEYRGDGVWVSLLSGEQHRVEAKTVVDATLMETSVPLTHRRSFTTGEAVACAPPNDLPRLAPSFQHFVVLGGGKTAMDSVVWLLDQGLAPDKLSWVVPRDAWIINRLSVQPGLAFMESTGRYFGLELEAAAAADSVDDLCLRLEATGNLMRLDPAVRPSMFHAASMTVRELELARRAEDVIRLGHVTGIEAGRLILDRGERSMPSGTLYIDCTARALAGNVGVCRPVFEPGRISLQMIRQFQPTFSAALIGHIEASIDDMAEKESLAAVSPMTDTPEDFVQGLATSLTNEAAWTANEKVLPWLTECRLNLISSWLDPSVDPGVRDAIMGRIAASTGPAIENLQRLGTASAVDA